MFGLTKRETIIASAAVILVIIVIIQWVKISNLKEGKVTNVNISNTPDK